MIKKNFIIFFLLIAANCLSQNKVNLNLLPLPQHVSIKSNTFHKINNCGIDESIVKKRLIKSIPEAIVNQEEAYKLNITPDTILIQATSNKGFYWAKQTLKQIISSSDGKSIPCLEIIDYPAFSVRGFMHDVGRSFISVEELKNEIELLSQFKINVFHWHLTENQAWRLQSKVFPQLNDSANFTRFKGQYYTIQDAKEIDDWCKKHQMMLIPEIDMPGHSAAFERTMRVDMQSDKGVEILKQLLREICVEIFPDVEYIHIGTDEVEFTNPNFAAQMVDYIRSLGKKVVSWSPGWKYKPGEIDMIQMWSYRGKPINNTPAIDSRYHYINHYDTFGDIIALYNSKIYNQPIENNEIKGSIVGIWNDRILENQTQILLQNNFYPSILALAERSWKGGGSEYFDKNGTILPTNPNDTLLQSFIDFENRLLWHKNHTLKNEPLAYIKQTNIKWKITDAFPNGGNLSKKFPPDEKISDKYLYDNKYYGTKEAIGAGIYLRHVWGNLVPAFYKNPKENTTAYAYTWVWSPCKEQVGLWASTQDYSRSETDLAPMQGKWDYRESKIFINDKEVAPPVWENTHRERTNEITLKNENFSTRAPMHILLNKGWNKVFLKLPVGKFSTPEVRLQKWMFTFIFVTLDGKNEFPGLIYSPDKTL